MNPEVTGPQQASVTAAALCARSPTGRCVWISTFLLLILVQMFTSLMLFAGVFILSDHVRISPFLICRTRESGELQCSQVTGAESESKINILPTVVILGLYIPVVLVAFALLAMLLAAYAKDRASLWLSAACQTASSLLMLIGIVGFLLLNQLYVTWEDMTPWFYSCVGAQVELTVTAVLTCVSGRRLMSDWK